MYCYIQEIQMKSSNSRGCGKELVASTSTWSINGVTTTSYGYTYSDDYFERPIKTAYKISIHDKSYRDDKGKVRKRQYYLTTIKYYDLIDYSWTDCLISSKVDDIAEEMDIEPDVLWKEIEDKLDALSEKVNKKFEQTEEYKVNLKHKNILRDYQEKKVAFAKKYEVRETEYDKCYDVFGKLKNPDYLNKIKADYKTRKEYEEKSRSYQQEYYSNYKNYSGNSGIGSVNSGLGSDKEKEYYKKFYRALATKFHPDVTGDNEAMQFINKLKELWGV